MPPKPFTILMVATSNVGVAFWRLWQPAKYISRHLNTRILCFEQDPHWQLGYGRWEASGESDFANRRENVPILPKNIGNELREALDGLWAVADAVIVQTIHFPFGIAWLQAMKEKYPKTPVYAESDDYIFETPSFNRASGSYAPGGMLEQVASDQMRMADGVIVSTPYLAELYKQFNSNIHVIPNAIDFEVWDKAFMSRPKVGLSPIVGWAGGASHDEDLRILLEPMQKVTRKHRAYFHVINGVPEFFKGVSRFKCFPEGWIPTFEFPMGLAKKGFDIGVAPLLDSNFARSKSNLKYLEFSALGLPTVASKVEPYARSIRNGETGYLASTSKEWEEALGTLLENPKQRRIIGSAARQYVREKFNLAKVAKRYLNLLRESGIRE